MKSIQETIKSSDNYINYLKTKNEDYFVVLKEGARFRVMSVCDSNTNIFIMQSVVGNHLFYPTYDKEAIENLWKSLEMNE